MAHQTIFFSRHMHPTCWKRSTSINNSNYKHQQQSFLDEKMFMATNYFLQVQQTSNSQEIHITPPFTCVCRKNVTVKLVCMETSTLLTSALKSPRCGATDKLLLHSLLNETCMCRKK